MTHVASCNAWRSACDKPAPSSTHAASTATAAPLPRCPQPTWHTHLLTYLTQHYSPFKAHPFLFSFPGPLLLLRPLLLRSFGSVSVGALATPACALRARGWMWGMRGAGRGAWRVRGWRKGVTQGVWRKSADKSESCAQLQDVAVELQLARFPTWGWR